MLSSKLQFMASKVLFKISAEQHDLIRKLMNHQEERRNDLDTWKYQTVF